MCEYCDQLKHVLTQSPVTACPACARPLSATDTPHTCSSCVLYTLIHQNTFAQRWSDIQTPLTTTRHQQLHPSLNSPPPVKHTTPPSDNGKPSGAILPIPTDITRTQPNMLVNLALPTHTLAAIQQVLTATPISHQCTTTHVFHSTLPLTMTQVHSFNRLIQENLDRTISHRVIYHHLRVTAMSTLIPCDRTLKITLDNTIHILTPPRTGSVAIPHHLHLYLDPHDRLPYL